jgi:hypothetical protein
MRRSRSASRATRSRLRRNCGSWGGSSCSRARALAELVDEAAVSEDAVHLPVGRDRPQVHDFHVPLGAEAVLRALRVVTLDEHSESVHRTEEQSCGPSLHNKKSAARTHGEVDSAANGVMRSRTTAPGTASERAPVRVMSRVRSIKARRVPIGTVFCRSRCISHKIVTATGRTPCRPLLTATMRSGVGIHLPVMCPDTHRATSWRRQLSAGNELSVGSRRGGESRVSFIAVSISAGLEAPLVLAPRRSTSSGAYSHPAIECTDCEPALHRMDWASVESESELYLA